MKRFVIAVVIMAAMLGSSGVVLYGLTQVKDEMIASLDELTQMVEDKEYDRAHELSEQLFHRWDEEENRLIRYVRHTDLDIIRREQLVISHIVLFDSHESSGMIRLGIAIASISTDLYLFYIFIQL